MEKTKITNDVISRQRTLLMGFAIISIMFFHYIEDCVIHHVNYNAFFRIWNQWIASAGVDVFVFVSGLGLYYSMKKDGNIMSFYRKRIIKLLIPYIVVAVPAVVYRDIIIQGSTMEYAVKEIFFVTFFAEGKNWFWYIGFSILAYAIFPYLFRIIDSSNDEITEEMRMLNLITMVTVFALALSGAGGNIFKYTNIALLRLPIFIAGSFYGKSSYEKRTTGWKWLVIFIFALFIRYMDMNYSMNSIIIRRYSLGLINISLCFFVAVLFTRLDLKFIRVVIEWFGNHSLWLYLLHVAIRGILNAKGYYTYQLKYELTVVIGSIVLAFIMQGIVNIVERRIKKIRR